MKRPLSAVLVLAAASALSIASLTHATPDLSPAVQSRSIADLRAAGPAGLAAVLAEYDRTKDASLLPVIDSVAAQHDAAWSRLYWHTDMQSALAAARAEHKPILALRLLGKLTDEYSCANSRFFRTALYANDSVSKLLREKFVLVWTSERPVPVISIDFGDGRTLKRTITGNSIHYVLSPDGRLIDALPGLYDPDTFAAALSRAIPAALNPSPAALATYRSDTLTSLDADWAALGTGGPAHGLAPAATPAPTARQAAPRAESKLRAETRLVNALQPAPAAPPAGQAMNLTAAKGLAETHVLTAFVPVPQELDSTAWAALASKRPARLDQHSIDLIRSQNPAAYANSTALDLVINNFQQAMAIDTLRNNHLFRPQILQWLSEQSYTLESLNTRVYAELFLTPRSDPWLGLVPDSTYSALTNDGCSVP